MTPEKVQEMLEEHAEALKIYDEQVSALKRRNAELEQKLENHLTEHNVDMVNLVKLILTLYQSFHKESHMTVVAYQSEIVNLLHGLHTRFNIDLDKPF